MQAYIPADIWQLSFCAAYIVPPCRGMDPSEIGDLIMGSDVPILSEHQDFLLNLFVESADKCVVDVAFVAEGDKQENGVRSLVRSVALGDSQEKSSAAQDLACRLASATTHRSSHGLLMVLSGEGPSDQRVLLGKFPADESIQASLSDQGMSVRRLRDAFSRKSSYFKAAVFDGNQAKTAFWRGRVEDRQARQRAPEAAKFWISDFLSAQPALTEVRGTKVLARALRETLRGSKTASNRDALVAAATVIKSQPDRQISLREFANKYLPEADRTAFIKNAGGEGIADAIFRIDPVVLEKELRFQTIVLDGSFTVTGPLEHFDQVVSLKETDDPGITEISLRGAITSRAVGTARTVTTK